MQLSVVRLFKKTILQTKHRKVVLGFLPLLTFEFAGVLMLFCCVNVARRFEGSLSILRVKQPYNLKIDFGDYQSMWCNNPEDLYLQLSSAWYPPFAVTSEAVLFMFFIHVLFLSLRNFSCCVHDMRRGLYGMCYMTVKVNNKM